MDEFEYTHEFDLKMDASLNVIGGAIKAHPAVFTD